MKKNEYAQDWLKRAKSNIARAKLGKSSEEVFYEDLCFDIQQSVEKAFKAVCVLENVVFPKTHNIAYLIELLEEKGINVPEQILESKILNDYAVESRYPGDYEPVEEEDYLRAIEIADDVLNWVEIYFKNKG